MPVNVRSTNWSNGSSVSTNWSKSTVNSSNWAKGSLNSTNWDPSKIFSESFLLLTDGSSGLLFTNDTDLLGLTE